MGLVKILVGSFTISLRENIDEFNNCLSNINDIEKIK